MKLTITVFLALFLWFVYKGVESLETLQSDGVYGFTNPEYIEKKKQIRGRYSEASQFCLNGAAFKLIGKDHYARQYEAAFGDCIESIVNRERLLNA